MSENPQQPQRPEGDPNRPPGEQPPPPQHGHPPYGQQPYAHQPYPYRPDAQEHYGARPGRQPDPGIQDPGLYPGVEQPPSRVAAVPSRGGENFFSALFDYSFSRYITPTIVKVVYVVITILVALGWLGALIAAFQAGWLPGVLFLLLGWVVALVYLAIARISLEFFVAVIAIAQKVNRYAERDGLS